MAVTIKGFASDWSVPEAAKAGIRAVVGTFTGNIGQPFSSLGDATTGAGFVLKPTDDTRQGVIGWQHASPSGYLMHFESRPGGAAPAAMIGIGLDNASPTGAAGVGGILISNKKRATGLSITNGNTITHDDAYGLRLNQDSIAPMVYATMTPGSAPLFRLQAGSGMNTERVLELITVNGTSGTIDAKDGRLNWHEPVRLLGSRSYLQMTPNTQIPETQTNHTFLRSAGSVDFHTYSGSSGTWFPKRIAAAGQGMSLEVAANYSGATTGTPATWIKGLEIRKAAGDNASLGFFGAVPVAKPTGVPVTPEGIHAALVSLGLIAA